jgi:putative transposase
VLLVVLWRLRYKLSLRDLVEMFLERGFVFTHEAVGDWQAQFAPLIADQLRAKRRGQRGAILVRGRNVCQRQGNMVLSLLCH